MSLFVDAAIPAGNAIIEEISGDTIRFRPDLRDTAEPWFYWNLRVRGCAGRRLRFVLRVPHSLTVRGAAVSRDDGWNWSWIPGYDPAHWTFEHGCGQDDELQFSLAMPYTSRNLSRRLLRRARGSIAEFQAVDDSSCARLPHSCFFRTAVRRGRVRAGDSRKRACVRGRLGACPGPHGGWCHQRPSITLSSGAGESGLGGGAGDLQPETGGGLEFARVILVIDALGDIGVGPQFISHRDVGLLCG